MTSNVAKENEENANYFIALSKHNSELLKQRNELLNALKQIQKQFNKDGNLTGYFYEICEQAIKNATNA